MKVLKFTLDYSKLPGAEENPVETQARLFEELFYQALRAVNPKGLAPRDSRTVARIMEALDASTDGFLRVEQADFDLIKETFESPQATLDPGRARVLVQYLEAIEIAENSY